MIHVFAMLAVAAIMLFVYWKVQDFVAYKLAQRKAAFRASVKDDVELHSMDAPLRVDGERHRVSAALGFAPSKTEMLARISKMSDEERAVAAQKIAQIVKQPTTVKLETLIDLAYARWDAINEYAAAEQKAK